MEAKVTTSVCDVCREIAVETISWKSEQGTRQNDLCAEHYELLMKNSHAPRKGPRPKSG